MIQVILLIGCLWAGTLGADPIAEAERERAETTQALKSLKTNVQLGAKRVRLIETEIQRLNTESRTLTRKIVAAQTDLKRLESEEQTTEQAIAQTNQRLDALIQTYQKELVAYYLTGKTIRPDQSDDTDPFSDYIPFVLESRNRTVAEIQKEQTTLKQLLENQVETTEEAAQAVDQLKRARTELQSKTEDQKQLLASIQRDLSTQQQKRRALTDDLQALEKRIAALTIETADASLAPLKGRLNWPVDGRVIRRFGQTREDGFGDWQGMVISAIDNSEVRAVQAGKVAYAGYLLGYGLVVVIAHNDGHATIYGHNRELRVQTGDTVAARQAIAITGNTGSLEVAGVYFGLTRNGKPINPTPWLN